MTLRRGAAGISNRVIALVALAMLVGPSTQAMAADTVGLVDPSQGSWHLRSDAGLVTSFFFGNPGDYPIVGDWDCDGTDTPGMYRQSDGFVYLSNANKPQTADLRFFFGDPGDIPLAGDFNGDGCDTVSVYRPSEGRFFIINRLGEDGGKLGDAETDYLFGDPGDKPFVGDFNGNGVETVGLHRDSTGLVYFRLTHSQGPADAQFIFGNPGDRLVAGDWGIVDGVDSAGLFRPSDATFFFRYSNTEGAADGQLSWGESPWLPVVGTFNLLVEVPSPPPPPPPPPPDEPVMVAFIGMSNDGAAAEGYREFTGLDVGEIWPVTRQTGVYRLSGQSIDQWANPDDEVWRRVFDSLSRSFPPTELLIGIGVKSRFTLAETVSHIQATVATARARLGPNIPFYLLPHPELESETDSYQATRLKADEATAQVLALDPTLLLAPSLPVLTDEMREGQYGNPHPNALGQLAYGEMLAAWVDTL